GFVTLLIAQNLQLDGDTLEMLRAVLDTNVWLATHVVMVTLGYSATFLAGILGIIYIFRGLLTKSFDETTAKSLGRMMYGIVCFATLFSFVGTMCLFAFIRLHGSGFWCASCLYNQSARDHLYGYGSAETLARNSGAGAAKHSGATQSRARSECRGEAAP